MRDPARIDRITDKINQIWKQYPDMRFWQLMLNIAWDYRGDFFYLEDDRAEKALDTVIKEGL